MLRRNLSRTALVSQDARTRPIAHRASFEAQEPPEVPVETVRNWEQGKRSPRGPARALLKVLEQAPDAAFAVLGKAR